MTQAASVHVPLGDRAYDVLIGPGLLGDAGRALADLEDSELAELETPAGGQLVDHRIQEVLDHVLDQDLLLAEFLGAPVDQLLLGRRSVCLAHGCEGGPRTRFLAGAI